jgi:hypothetical protein
MKILATIFTPWITLFILASQVLGSPSSIKDTVTVQPRRTVEAHRLHELILVDGILSEAEWQRAGICDFTQREPIEGAAPTQKTEVWVAYDDEALFVAAQLYDSSPDSIVDRIARRDASLNADWFSLASMRAGQSPMDQCTTMSGTTILGMACGNPQQKSTVKGGQWK